MTYFYFLFDYFYHIIINTFLKRQKNQSFLIDLIINIALVRRFLLLERMTGVEPYLTKARKPLNSSDLAAFSGLSQTYMTTW